MTFEHIYGAIVERLTLTKGDRRRLHQDRGLSDATIDTLRYRSSSPEEVKRAIVDLEQEFGAEELVHSCLAVRTSSRLKPNPQILKDRILIPYLDAQGRVTRLRPHKLGFKGTGVAIYCPLLLAGASGHAVLTEGEFKAAAGKQLGVPTIAVPGVSSFAGKHFGELVALLQENKITNVTILFDREDKENPAYPRRFKEKPWNRFDSEFWAARMAVLLGEAGVETLVAAFPEEWMNEGKADIDGSLARGLDSASFRRILGNALPADQFVVSLPPHARRIVRSKLQLRSGHLLVKSGGGRYWAKIAARGQKGAPATIVWRPISNFTLEFRHTLVLPESRHRVFQFIDEFGEAGPVCAVPPEVMADKGAFEKLALSKGNFLWTGSHADLVHTWTYVLLHDDGTELVRPQVLGRTGDRWVFSNAAIVAGACLSVGGDGVIRVDGGGIVPPVPEGDGLLDLPRLDLERAVDLGEFIRLLRQNLGSYIGAIGIGWCVALLTSDEIFRRYRVFPILFVGGRRQGGKTTLADIFAAFFGMREPAANLESTTMSGLARSLASLSSLPLRFDEYRNTKKIVSFEPVLRSAYDRQPRKVGAKTTGLETKSYAVRAGLLLAGETTPADNALFSRITHLKVSAGSRDATVFPEIRKTASKLSSVCRELLVRHVELSEKVLLVLRKLIPQMEAKGLDSRIALNYAIPVAGLMAGAHALGVDLHDYKGILEEAITLAQGHQDVKEEEHLLADLLGFVGEQHAQGKLGDLYKIDGEHLLLWLKAVFTAYEKDYRSRKGDAVPFKYGTFLDLLSEEEYFVWPSRARHSAASPNGKQGARTLKVRLQSGTQQCVVLKIDLLPDVLEGLAERKDSSPALRQLEEERNRK